MTVEEVLGEIREKTVLRDACKVGVKKPDSIIPIKFSLNSSDQVNQVLRNAKHLQNKEGTVLYSVYICPDRYVDERKA